MNTHQLLKSLKLSGIAIILILGLNINKAQGQEHKVEVQQITSGTKHHFFGYVGHSLTIPWNESGKYIVSLRSDFYKRMPKKGESADVILIDTQDNYKVIPVDKTLAWNLQQGTMLYWNPNEPESQFFFNDLDPKTGLVFTVLYDINKRKRIKEYRFRKSSVANGGIAPNGEYFAGINYGKITRTREVISYTGAKDFSLKGPANPDDDGLFKVDIATGKRKLLVSYKRLAEFLKIEDENYPIYVHHTLWNRNSDRLIFIVRGSGNVDGRSKYPNVACVIHPDGTGLGLIEYGGHPEWVSGNLLSIPGEDVYELYDVDKKEVVDHIGIKGEGIFRTPGDDNAFSPDGKWYVGSYKPTRKLCEYTFYRLKDKSYVRVPAIKTDAPKAAVTRIDPAPRWNRTSDAILAPGLAEDGSRQMFIVRLLPAD